MSFQERLRPEVVKAALWLDGVKPGWAHLIDIDRLNMLSGAWCVCGQVFAREARGTWWRLRRDGARDGYAYAMCRWWPFPTPFSAAFSGAAAETLWLDEIAARVMPLDRDGQSPAEEEQAARETVPA